MKISIKSNINASIAGFTADLNRAVEIATQRALIKTAQAVNVEVTKEMERVFDRPTRWTLKSFRTEFDKEKMQARVEVKDGYWHRAANYLQTQIVGGSRKHKAFELALRSAGILPSGWYVVPGQRAELDAHGNMKAGQIRQILSWFDSAEKGTGSTHNMGDKGRDKRRKGTRSKRGFEYVAVIPGRQQGSNLHPGIYKRTFFAFTGSGGGKLVSMEPVMIFVQHATYSPRFDFYGVAQKTVNNTFNNAFDIALKGEMDRVNQG